MPGPTNTAYDPAGQGGIGIVGNAGLNLRLDPGAAVTCHTPLIMPPSGSITAQFYGYTTPLPYDTSDGAIAMFPASVNGAPAYGLCIDHGKGAPVGPYGNISIDQALNDQTPSVKLAVSFVLANVPLLPTDDASEFWEMLGLLDCYPGGLDGWDAWAVARYVVYHLLGQLSGGLNGLVYNTPKNDCLRAGGAALLSMALSYAGGTLDCGGVSGGGSGGAGASAGAGCCNCVCGGNYTCGGCCCPPDNCRCSDPCGLRMGCQIGTVMCCNTSTPVTDRSSTYLVFVGCPNDIRECCGRVVLGPFKLQSSNGGTPDISLVPCNGCQGADIQLTDFCCNILSQPPAVGEEFYIAFRPPCTRYCFDLCATMQVTSRAVYFFRSQSLDIQRIAIPLGRDETAAACIHICIDITPETPPPPGPEPWWEHILVNNNNNNNNNDSSNNANNSNLISNLVESLLALSSNMLGGMLNNGALAGGLGTGLGPGLGLGPPFPPGMPFLPGSGPFPPGPGPFPPGPGSCDGFPFPWKLFPPGTTPCPPPGCGGPNPCCCPLPWPQPVPCTTNNCCCPCPPVCPPPCWCPPPFPSCPPVCPPCPCPEPCFLPFPYIPEPGFIIQPASLTYQAVPMPVPCFCPPAWPQPMQLYPQMPQPMPYPPMQQPYSPYGPHPPGERSSEAPFAPPAMEPMPPLLPAFSSAPRPDLSPFEFADDGQSGLYDQFYRDWYGQ